MDITSTNALGLTKAEDSLKKRYTYKVGISLVGLPISLVTQALVPRLLGPAAYGDFSFLSAFFNQVVAFFDSGISSGFYSKLSYRSNEPGLLRFFWGLSIAISGLVFFSVLMIFGLQLDEGLWPGQEVRYIWLAVVWGVLAWYSQVINKVMDAYGLTVSSEIVRFQQKVLGVSILVLMFWLHRVSLAEFFLFQYAILFFLCAGWWVILRRNGLALFPKVRLTLSQVKGYAQEFYDYSAPLFAFAFVGLLVGVSNRWLLQYFAGSVEQAFYGISYQIGALCFLVTGSMTPLFWREMSKSFGEQNLAKMKSMFSRYVPLFYTIAAFLAVFVAVQAQKVSLLLGGVEFQKAALPISIMAIYPIHQTYGQLSGTLLLATGQTRLYRNLGIVMAILQLPLTFWLLAPATWFGLELGATGLAIQMVVIQLFGVNLQLWYNCLFLDLPFGKFLFHQFYSVALLISCAWLSAGVVDRLVENTLLAFVGSGVLYTMGCIGLVFLLPTIVAMSRTEVKDQLALGWLFVRRRIRSG